MIERKSSVKGYMNEESWTEGSISATVAANGMLFFSGLAAIGEDLKVVAPDDMAGQLEFCLQVLEDGLADHGADWSNLVSIVAYVTDEDAFMANYGILAEKFAGNAPTSTSIGVRSLAMPGLVVEIVPIAAL